MGYKLKPLQVEIVIPVYNEEEAIGPCVDRLVSFFEEEFIHHWTILIANNGSLDRTLEIATEISRRDTRIQVLDCGRKGRGYALRLAWSRSHADIVSYMDVDLSTNLRYFPLLVEGLRCGYDIAVGSRLMQASIIARRFKREVLSRGFNLLIRLLFRTRFTDAQCGFKALWRESAQLLLPHIVNNGWFLDAEMLILAEKNHFRIFEAPVEWMEDLDSRVRLWSTAVEDIRGLLRLRSSCLHLEIKKKPRPLLHTTRTAGKGDTL